ncbi:MAG: hypothetical protein GX279_08210 [Clostridiaceae bacterium]|nr:hypothetical protein [Clostridiaceae bacterium]
MKPEVEAIRKERDVIAVISMAGIILTGLFIVLQIKEAAIVCIVVCALPLILLYRQGRLLSAAKLICDNPILTVPSSVITAENRAGERMTEETIVSTFGLLLGSKVYKWGCDGISGTRLQRVRLDRNHIWLTFGVDNEVLCIKLLHGITDKARVMEITQKLWRETGVQAEVSD